MTVSEAPKASFQLSQLIYDTRYRALTIQVITLLLVVAGVWWLIANLLANLDALGLTPSFNFLSARAGYDISQSLIDYNNSMSHGACSGCRYPEYPAGRRDGLRDRHRYRGDCRGAAPVQELGRVAPDGGLCRRLPQCPLATVDPAGFRDHDRNRPRTVGVSRGGHGVDPARWHRRHHQSRRLYSGAGLWGRIVDSCGPVHRVGRRRTFLPPICQKGSVRHRAVAADGLAPRWPSHLCLSSPSIC